MKLIILDNLHINSANINYFEYHPAVPSTAEGDPNIYGEYPNGGHNGRYSSIEIYFGSEKPFTRQGEIADKLLKLLKGSVD